MTTSVSLINCGRLTSEGGTADGSNCKVERQGRDAQGQFVASSEFVLLQGGFVGPEAVYQESQFMVVAGHHNGPARVAKIAVLNHGPYSVDVLEQKLGEDGRFLPAKVHVLPPNGFILSEAHRHQQLIIRES